MNQERSLQVSQKGLIREYEKKRDELLNAEMQKRLDSLNEIASKKEEEAVLKSREYQADLEGQLEEIAERKRDDHKQFLREKAMVDEIIQKIREEEDKEQEFRMLQAKETKQFIQDYIVQRQEYKKAELERIKLENKKIEDYAKFIEQREKDLSTKKLEESKGRSEIYERLAAEMERKDQEKTDLEDLRLALYLEEESEANRMFEQV